MCCPEKKTEEKQYDSDVSIIGRNRLTLESIANGQPKLYSYSTIFCNWSLYDFEIVPEHVSEEHEVGLPAKYHHVEVLMNALHVDSAEPFA